MKRIMKAVIPLTAALVLAAPQTVRADYEISDVSITISSSIMAGDSDGEVEASTDSLKYEVEDVEIKNEPMDEWEDGDNPKLKITLVTQGDYTFKSGFSKDDVDLDGDDGEVTSVSRSKHELIVHVRLDDLEDDNDYDLEVYDLEWEESTGYASWECGDDADSFEVRLLRDGSSVTSTLTTNESYYHFAPYFYQNGEYIFRVRAIRNSSHKGDWEESRSLDVNTTDYAQANVTLRPVFVGGAWLQDSVGWWYCNADRSYTKNDWQLIDNRWYYFNEQGYRQTGWIQWNSKWYYCGADGAMLSNTITPDGYQVGSDGAWIQ